MQRTTPISVARARITILAATGLGLSLATACQATDTGKYKHGAPPAKQAKKADAKAVTPPKVIKAPEIKKAPPGPHDAPPAKIPADGKYKKGLRAPKGLPDAEVPKYNVAQGDPSGGSIDLKTAFAGDADLQDKSKGKLHAILKTTMGDLECELFEDKVPGTVANFVGLSRGTRPFYDQMEDKWITGQPYYKDVAFHRVIKNFMAQTGDRSGSGRGNPGFVIVDEFDKTLRHKGPGILSMANRGKNTGSTQFFITVKSTPHLDKKHAVFGKCKDAKVATAITEVPVQGSRPIKPIKLKSVEIVRK